MSLGSITFDAIRSANADLRCTIETKNSDVINALCAGVQNMRLESEIGKGDILQALVRIKTDSKTDTGFDKGDKLTLTDSEGDIYNVRIMGIKNASGLTSLMVEAIDG